MFDHVTIRASDRAASEQFYELVLSTLAIEKTHTDEDFPEWDDFSLSQASDEKPATRRLHIAFAAPSEAHVDEFWGTGTEAGYRDDGAPGPRPQYRDDYYGSFLLDPDGNSAEAVHHGAMRGAREPQPLVAGRAGQPHNRVMSERIVPEDELQAAIEARKELGAEMEPAVIDSFVERIERRLAERSDQSEKALKQRRDHQKEMVLGGMAISIPLFALAAIFTGLAGVIVVCAVLAVIAVVTARQP